MITKTILIASLAVAMTLSLSMVQPAEASEYESTFNKSPTAYYTDDLTIPENQHLAVEGMASLLNTIETTENPATKATYQKHLENNVVPYMAQYGVFMPGTEITSSMVPAADGRGTITVKKAFEVKAWISYNCEPIKCTTVKVLKKLGFNELYSTSGVIGNHPSAGLGSGADLEFHHEVKNVNAASPNKIKLEHWGTFKDYSRGMTINCTTDSGSTPVVKYFATMTKNRAYDIRYCDVDGIAYGDRITAAIKINYYS